MVLGVVAAAVGIWFAATYDTAPGATIVLVAIAVFAAIAVGASLWRRRRRTRSGPLATAEAEPPDVVLQS
jgi:zinc transport system permease protein